MRTRDSRQMIRWFDACSNLAAYMKLTLCFAMSPCREVGLVDEEGGVGFMLGYSIILGTILGEDSDSWGGSGEGGSADRRLAAHSGVKHLAPFIHLVRIEIIRYRQDPTMSTGSALDATYPVCRDWRHPVQAASLPPPHAHS